MTILAALDPGTHTGYAQYQTAEKAFDFIETVKLHTALGYLTALTASYPGHVFVIFEDARKRRWFGSSGREKLQGAGSVKRDCSIIEEFCEDLEIPYYAQAPRSGLTKLDAEVFKSMTGWTARTSEHARDAAMLVHGMTDATVTSLMKTWEQRK
jgi:hypothetical protein